MWSSKHPYIFKPLPSVASQNSVADSKMKYSQVLELLPNFQMPKVEVSDDEGSHSDCHEPLFKPFVFDILMTPKEESKLLPDLFCYKYASTMGEVVSLKDPTGNVIFIKVNKMLDEIHLTEGWKTLIPFYNVSRGSWMRMAYVSLDRFYIRLFDDHDKEITYPSLHLSKYTGGKTPSTKILHGYPVTTSINPAKFLFSTRKTLDIEEALDLKLKLLKSFCFHALTKNDAKISIVDEH